jgi:hypothetical protein
MRRGDHWTRRRAVCVMHGGKYKIVMGSASCTDCGVNTYSAAVGATLANTCSPCPVNMVTTSTGQTSSNNCVCAAGFFNLIVYTTCTGTGYCHPQYGCCNKYAYGLANDNYCNMDGMCSQCCECTDECGYNTGLWATGSSCIACVAGKYSSTIGALLSNTCLDCVAGKYSAATGAAAESSCSACAAGKYSAATGAAAESSCSACTAGKYSSAIGSLSCIDCVAGKYSTAVAAASIFTCAYCGAGKYSATGASVCADCGAGKYSAATGAAAESSCLACRDCSGLEPRREDAGTW